VFYVNETSTDHQETFFKHVKLQLTEHFGRDTSSFKVINDLAKWKVEFYPPNVCKDYVCVGITLLASKQNSVNIAMTFDFKTQDFAYILHKLVRFNIRLHRSAIHIMTSRNNIANPTNRLLDADNNTFTVVVRGSYVINSQHNVVTSPPQFVALEHKTVDITYTWTMCNLILPLNDGFRIVSAPFPSTFDQSLPEFQIKIYSETKIDKYISNYISLLSVPITVKLPLNVSYSFELIDSSDKHSVVAQRDSVYNYFDANKTFGIEKCFKYSNFVNSMNDHRCATIKCRTVYDISTNHTQ
jgi:hypothetical protein